MQPKLTALAMAMVFLVAIGGHCQNRIVVIGSSTACGVGLANPYEESWVNRVKNYYLAQQVISNANNVVNLAEPSTNCVTGMPTGFISPYLVPDFLVPNPAKNITAALQLNPKPTVIIVSYPSNGYDWMPFQNIISHLKTIKSTADAAGIPCFITTTQPRNQFSPEERQKLKSLRDSIMSTFGNSAIDFWTPLALADNTQNPLYAVDNTHPNAAGHELLFQQVIEKNIFGIALAPLAVSNIDLKISRGRNKIFLNWNIESDDAGSYFIVERTLNVQHFAAIGKLASAAVHKYTFTDSTAVAGKLFYRIDKVNRNGRVEFSKVVSIDNKESDINISSVFPNVTSNGFQVHISSNTASRIRMYIVNIQGATVYNSFQQVQKGDNSFNYSLTKYPAGSYYLVVEKGATSVSEKLIKTY